MRLSQKCFYALRAIFEMARHRGQTPLSIAAIAEAQGIPAPFLQAILREMKQGGFVESRRGQQGGYLLARNPRRIAVGEVIRFVEGTAPPAEPDAQEDAFAAVWQGVNERVNGVLDNVTFADLVARARARSRKSPDYVI